MSKRKLPSAVEPRNGPKQERSRRTYRAILRGAAESIRKFGVQKLSTNKVAEESGVSIGSLYQYFPSKEAIIAALIDQTLEQEYLRVKDCLSGISPKIGARQVIMDIFSLYYKVEPEDLNYRKVMTDAVSTVGKAPEAIKFHRSVAELIINFIHKHYSCAQTRTDHDTTIFIVQYVLRATALSSVDADLKKIDIANLVGELSEVLMDLLKVSAEHREAIP